MKLSLALFSLCCLLMLAMGGAISAAPATPDASAARAHAAVKRVLAREEFTVYPPTPVSRATKHTANRFANALKRFLKPIGKLLSKISTWIKRLLPQRLPGNHSPMAAVRTGVHYLILIILGLVVLSLLGLLIYRVMLHRQAATARKTRNTSSASPVRRAQEPSYWDRSLQEAEACWQQGKQREALRTLYRACLVLLDARGVLRYDESRANGEVLRELRRHGHGAVQEELTPIVRCFDRSWYGFLPLTPDDFSQTVEKSRSFREAVIRRSDAHAS